MPQFRIHHAVEFEFREVRAWYAGHSPWRRMFRRVRLVRFPYLVIFHADAQTTSVLALVHQRQEPERKKAMLSRRLVEFN